MSEIELELQQKTCELFEDIVDCLMASRVFGSIFCIAAECEDYTLYKYTGTDFWDVYVAEIHMYKKNEAFLVTIHINNINSLVMSEMYFKIDPTLQSVNQSNTLQWDNQSNKNGKENFVFLGGLRMDSYDIEILEKVLEWCEQYNPGYW